MLQAAEVAELIAIVKIRPECNPRKANQGDRTLRLVSESVSSHVVKESGRCIHDERRQQRSTFEL